MRPAAGETRRSIRPGVYVVVFLFFATIVFLSHLPFASLPYFWDEAGQFIPAALDIFHHGLWIPHSTVPNVHPPAVMGYLAAAWRVAGFHPATTRFAMLLLASFAVLTAFLLAIELSREVRGSPAFLATGLLCASPLFFAQAMLAQLDAPAMLFTALALLLFLQDHIPFSVIACIVLVAAKETGVAVPLTFACWLAYERRWREAAYFLTPALLLLLWILALAGSTGHWAGNSEFVRYNLLDQLHPLKLATTFLRRLYYVFVANLHWVGTIAILYAWRRSRVYQSRSWRVAWLLIGVHLVMVTLLGGAVLERYLLPLMPVIYSAMAVGLSFYRKTPQVLCSLLLLAGLMGCNFLNPPYPFPYEDNLAFTDFLKLQLEVADYLTNWHPNSRVHTIWPMTAELSQPELGFVSRPIKVLNVPDFAPETLDSIDWSKVQIFVSFSQSWDPHASMLHFEPALRLWQRFFDYVPSASRVQTRERVLFPVTAHFERRGQWIDVFVNPTMPRGPDTGILARPLYPSH